MAKENQDELDQRKTTGRLPGPGLVVPLINLAIIAGYLFLLSKEPKRTKIEYSFFLDQLRAKNVAEVELLSRYAVGKFREQPLLPADEAASASQEKQRTAAKQPSSTQPGTGQKAAANGKEQRAE